MQCHFYSHLGSIHIKWKRKRSMNKQNSSKNKQQTSKQAKANIPFDVCRLLFDLFPLFLDFLSLSLDVNGPSVPAFIPCNWSLIETYLHRVVPEDLLGCNPWPTIWPLRPSVRNRGSLVWETWGTWGHHATLALSSALPASCVTPSWVVPVISNNWITTKASPGLPLSD